MSLLLVVALAVCLFATVSNGEDKLKPVANVNVSEPAPKVPEVAEITFADFDDFGITFEEFVNEYNNAEIDGELNPYIINYFGLNFYDDNTLKSIHELALTYAGKQDKVFSDRQIADLETKILLMSNTKHYIENGGMIFLFSPPKYSNRKSYPHGDYGLSDVSVFIKTDIETEKIFAITVNARYSSKGASIYRDVGDFLKTEDLQRKIFTLMSKILLKKMEARGVSERVIKRTELKISDYNEMKIPYISNPPARYRVSLTFSVKEGVNRVLSKYIKR